MSIDSDARAVFLTITGGEQPQTNPELFNAITRLLTSSGLSKQTIAMMTPDQVAAAERSATAVRVNANGSPAAATGSTAGASTIGQVYGDEAPAIGAVGSGAGGGSARSAKTITESFIAQGYTQEPSNPNILFKWVEQPDGSIKMDVVDVSRLAPGGSGGGSGSGGGVGRTRTIVHNASGRALIIDENGNTVGENTDLYKAPDPKAPDIWHSPDTGSVFEFRDGKFTRNPELSSNKAGTVQINQTTGNAYQWNSKTGAWDNAPQFNVAPTVSPMQEREDAMRRFDLSRGDEARRFDISNTEAVRGQQNSSAVATRGQDFSLATALGQLALEDSKFFRDTVGRGSDYISRAYTQRGGTSPLPMVTNADIINSLSGGRAAAQATIDRLAAERPKFNFAAPTAFGAPTPLYTAPPPAAAPPKPTAPAPATWTTASNGGPGVSYAPTADNAATAAFAKSMGIKFAFGTKGKGTTARKFIVGDEQVPNVPNPEVVTVHKPGKDTTVEVEPMNMPRFAFGTESARSTGGGRGKRMRDNSSRPDKFDIGGGGRGGNDGGYPSTYPGGGFTGPYYPATPRGHGSRTDAPASGIPGVNPRANQYEIIPGRPERLPADVLNALTEAAFQNARSGGNPDAVRWLEAFSGGLPMYAFGTDVIDGGAGSGATGVTPGDLSAGYLSGAAYDWYDPQTGSAGYGAFSPGGGDSGGDSGGAGSAASPAAPAYYAPTAPVQVPGSAGSGVRLPTLGTVNQADLVTAAKNNAGPAITNLMSGGKPPPLRFNFALPTLGALNSLTDDEKEAYNAYLGVVENSSLADVARAAQQTLGRTGTGYGARQRAFAL